MNNKYHKIIAGLLAVMVLFTGVMLVDHQEAYAFSLSDVTGWISDAGEDSIFGACKAVSFGGGLFDGIKDTFKNTLDDISNNLLGDLIDLSFDGLGFNFGPNSEVPTGDAGARSAAVTGATSQQAQEEQQDCEDFMRDTVLGSFSKRLMDSLADDVIGWIQGDGTPRFIEDTGGWLGGAADAAFGDVLIELGLGDLCDGDFGRLGEEIEIIMNKPDRFSENVRCTLSDALSNSQATAQEYYDNFRTGGWVTFKAQTSPRNNRWGLRTLVSSQLIAAQEQKRNEKMLEAIAGNGYASQRVCNEWQFASFFDPAGNNQPGDRIIVDNANSDLHTRTPDGIAWSGQEAKPGQSNWQCVDSEIITPGSTIASAAEQVIQNDFEKASDEKGIGDYLESITDAAVTRLAGEATSGLSGLFDPSRGGSSRSNSGSCADLPSYAQSSCQAAQGIGDKWTNTPQVTPNPGNGGSNGSNGNGDNNNGNEGDNSEPFNAGNEVEAMLNPTQTYTEVPTWNGEEVSIDGGTIGIIEGSSNTQTISGQDGSVFTSTWWLVQWSNGQETWANESDIELIE